MWSHGLPLAPSFLLLITLPVLEDVQVLLREGVILLLVLAFFVVSVHALPLKVVLLQKILIVTRIDQVTLLVVEVLLLLVLTPWSKVLLLECRGVMMHVRLTLKSRTALLSTLAFSRIGLRLTEPA